MTKMTARWRPARDFLREGSLNVDHGAGPLYQDDLGKGDVAGNETQPDSFRPIYVHDLVPFRFEVPGEAPLLTITAVISPGVVVTKHEPIEDEI